MTRELAVLVIMLNFKIDEAFGYPIPSTVKEAVKVLAKECGKVKVPKWFDDEFGNLPPHVAIYHIARCGWGYGLNVLGKKDKSWSELLESVFHKGKDEENQISAIEAIIHGYEVEE